MPIRAILILLFCLSAFFQARMTLAYLDEDQANSEGIVRKALGQDFPRIFAMEADGKLAVTSRGQFQRKVDWLFLTDEKLQNNLGLTDTQKKNINSLHKELEAFVRRMQKEFTRMGVERSDARRSESRHLLLERANAAYLKFESDAFSELLPHQRKYHLQFLHQVRVRDEGLVFALLHGDFSKQLKLSNVQKSDIRKTAKQRAEKTRKKLQAIERKALNRLIEKTPQAIANYLTEAGLLECSMAPSVAGLFTERSIEQCTRLMNDVGDTNRTNESLSFRLFAADLDYGIRRGQLTGIYGNFMPLNNSFVHPYYSVPICQLLSIKSFQEKLNLSDAQVREIGRLEKKMETLFDEEYKQLEATLGAEKASEQVLLIRKEHCDEMHEVLNVKQQDQFNVLMLRHRIRNYGYATVAHSIANWQNIKLSRKELQAIVDEQNKICKEILPQLSALEIENEEVILDHLNKEQFASWKALVGERPQSFVPCLDRQLLDFEQMKK